MRKMLFVLLLIFVAVNNWSWSLFGQNTVTINSTPNGAQVYQQNSYLGTTPLTLTYTRGCFDTPITLFSKHLDNGITLTISKNGYYDQILTLTNGPYEWESFNKENHYTYFLISGHSFHVNLNQIKDIRGLDPVMEGENEWISYFNKNINSLNPIEGIWRITVNIKVYHNGELIRSEEKSQDRNNAIIKYGSSFRLCDIDGKNQSDLLSEYTATVNQNIYLFKRTFSSEVMTSNAVMTSIGLLEYNYEVGQEELKSILKNNFQPGWKMYRELKLIKTYPTQEVIITNQQGSGTGFALSSDGLIVTCYHVIENAEKIVVRGINSSFDRTYIAKVLASDRNNDIALIKIDDPTFKFIEKIPYIISDKTIDVGSSIFTLGYPLRSSMGDEIKLTNGIISSKSGFKGDITTYQISAPVQPGNSGCPLFDDSGNVVGIVNAKHVLAENATYAIKTNYLRNLIESLQEPPKINSINVLSTKTLSEKVKTLKNYIYIIEIN
ncbi:PEGA domain-containing protein [bacterium]|nr:MAG: PEGA domain-containing protein [bacterium]